MNFWGKRFDSALWRYGTAVYLTGIGLLLRLPIEGALGARDAYITFFPTVMLAAWLGGFGPGVLNSILSYFAADYFIIPPLHDIRLPTVPDFVVGVVFLATSIFISGLNDTLRKATMRSEERVQQLATETARRKKAEEFLEMQVTERTAQLKAANKELEEFAYVASHDLKAPLRVIDNASKWLEEDLDEHLSADNRENMALLRGRVKRMEKLLDDLLEYARIGRGSEAGDTETISGADLMADTLALLSYQGFTIAVDPGFTNIQVRKMPLQQIFLNLIGNAIKHHNRGYGNIQVTVELGDEFYSFSVADDGPGIPEKYQNQVFEMFQTLRPRDQVEGSGMGLAMVRKHVEVFGGTVSLRSMTGEGSTFRFTWPRRLTEKKEVSVG